MALQHGVQGLPPSPRQPVLRFQHCVERQRCQLHIWDPTRQAHALLSLATHSLDKRAVSATQKSNKTCSSVHGICPGIRQCWPGAACTRICCPHPSSLRQNTRQAFSQVASSTSAAGLPAAAATSCTAQRSTHGRFTCCRPAASSSADRSASKGSACSQAGGRPKAPSGLSLSSSKRSGGMARTCR